MAREFEETGWKEGTRGRTRGKQFTRNSPRRVWRLDTLLFVPSAICRLRTLNPFSSFPLGSPPPFQQPLQSPPTPFFSISHLFSRSAKPRNLTGILNTGDSSVFFSVTPVFFFLIHTYIHTYKRFSIFPPFFISLFIFFLSQLLPPFFVLLFYHIFCLGFFVHFASTPPPFLSVDWNAFSADDDEPSLLRHPCASHGDNAETFKSGAAFLPWHAKIVVGASGATMMLSL